GVLDPALLLALGRWRLELRPPPPFDRVDHEPEPPLAGTDERGPRVAGGAVAAVPGGRERLQAGAHVLRSEIWPGEQHAADRREHGVVPRNQGGRRLAVVGDRAVLVTAMLHPGVTGRVA